MSDSCLHVDCNSPGSSVHGVLQARILEWVAISSSRASSWPRDQTQVSCTAGRFFYQGSCIAEAMVFPIVVYGCESWTVNKAEWWRIDAFELWCWRRLLRVPSTARRSNQSILMEISPGYSLEGLMLKLKLQSFGHLMWRADSLEKTLMLGGIGGRRKRGWHKMRWLDGITDSMDVSWVNFGNWWWTGRPSVLWFMGSQRVGHDWVTEQAHEAWVHQL